MWKREESVQVVLDLGHSVVIHGELSASEDVTLYGQMEGSIRLPDHTLTIGPHADIMAEVSAKAVVIMGAVLGTVTARESVEIRATGSVTGDIRSPRLAVADGRSLRGRVEMTDSNQAAVARRTTRRNMTRCQDTAGARAEAASEVRLSTEFGRLMNISATGALVRTSAVLPIHLAGVEHRSSGRMGRGVTTPVREHEEAVRRSWGVDNTLENGSG
jgi:cytoskeletal protein CcmA (bactofilin family)